MKKNLLKNLCIILVSFRSKDKVQKTIKYLNKDISIILIENSMDASIKKEFESKFKNVKVIIPKSNDGQGAAFNIGAKKTKKKYLLFIDIDIKIKTSQIITLINKAIKIKKFGVITPKIKNHNYNGSIIDKNKNQDLHKVLFNHGCVMLVERNTFKKINYFDEKIFLYFEESDLFKKCIDANLPVYMYDKVIISNPKSKSIDQKFRNDYIKVRNWHYCWSKFYYYKKHYGYLNGIVKTLPNLIRAIKKITICFFQLRFTEMSYYFAEILGLLFSYLNFRSFYRLKGKI
mgnify:FL=1